MDPSIAFTSPHDLNERIISRYDFNVKVEENIKLPLLANYKEEIPN